MIVKSIQGTVATLTLNKTPANALDLPFLCRLAQELDAVEADRHIRGVVLSSGRRTVFSSGLDLRSLAGSRAQTGWRVTRSVCLVHAIVRRILYSKKLYVARLSGAVIGSAVSIVSACDFRFAAVDAWFWLPDPQYGGLLADGGIDLLGRLGRGAAQTMLLTGSRISSQDALRAGLVQEVLDKDLLADHTRFFLANLAAHSPKTLRQTKALINRGCLRPVPFGKLLPIAFSREMRERLDTYINNSKHN